MRARGDVGDGIASVLALLGRPDLISFAGGFPDPETFPHERVAALLRRGLVTGGSKGLGEAIARELISEGARVAICSRNKQEVTAVAEEVGVEYAQAADVTDPEQVRDLIARTAVRAAGNSFTKTLALEVAKDNILVNGFNIGFVITPQWENIHRQRAPELTREEFFDRFAA